jgi:hypothetical protein
MIHEAFEGGKLMRFGLIALIALWPSLSVAQDQGRFLGTLRLSEDRIADCFAEDTEGYYSLFRLSSEFGFEELGGRVWMVPNETCVNGASIPTAFWSVIGGPWSGPYRRASVVHDHFVRTKERTWQETHRVFYDAMLTSDVPKSKAKIMYFAVRRFGSRWEGRTKSVPVCAQGDVTNCKEWREREVFETLVTIPDQPAEDVDVNKLLASYEPENLTVEEIEEIADREVQAELADRF